MVPQCSTFVAKKEARFSDPQKSREPFCSAVEVCAIDDINCYLLAQRLGPPGPSVASSPHQAAGLRNPIFRNGYGSIPINTIFRGMNIHLPAILMFTRGIGFWPIPKWIERLMIWLSLFWGHPRIPNNYINYIVAQSHTFTSTADIRLKHFREYFFSCLGGFKVPCPDAQMPSDAIRCPDQLPQRAEVWRYHRWNLLGRRIEHGGTSDHWQLATVVGIGIATLASLDLAQGMTDERFQVVSSGSPCSRGGFSTVLFHVFLVSPWRILQIRLPKRWEKWNLPVLMGFRCFINSHRMNKQNQYCPPNNTRRSDFKISTSNTFHQGF